MYTITNKIYNIATKFHKNKIVDDLLKMMFAGIRRFTHQISKLCCINQYPKDAHDPCASFAHQEYHKT